MMHKRMMTKEELMKQYPLTIEQAIALDMTPIAQLKVANEMVEVKAGTSGGNIWCMRDKEIQAELIHEMVIKHGIKNTKRLLESPSSGLIHTIGSVFKWAETKRGQNGWHKIQKQAAIQKTSRNVPDIDKVYWEWNEMMDIAYKQQLEDKEKKKRLSEMPIEKKQAIADKINDLLNNI